MYTHLLHVLHVERKINIERESKREDRTKVCVGVLDYDWLEDDTPTYVTRTCLKFLKDGPSKISLHVFLTAKQFKCRESYVLTDYQQYT